MIASGSLEVAIITARTRQLATDLFIWVLYRASVVIVTVASSVLVFAALMLDAGARGPVVGFTAGVASMAILTVASWCASEWMVRNKDFVALSRFRVMQSGYVAAVKVAAGLAAAPINGLVFGEVLGRFASLPRFLLSVWDEHGLKSLGESLRRSRRASLRYTNFPRIHLPDQLLNILGGVIQVPIIGLFFGKKELGLVALVLSALYMPITVLSTAIKDAFRHRATTQYRETGGCRPAYVGVVIPVALVSLPAFLVLYLLAGDIFGFVFGAEWRQAGVYAAILVPMFYMNFVAMSANGVFVITGNLKASLVWQVVGFILPATGMLFGAVHVGTVEAALVGLCAAKSISFALHMALSYGLAKGRS